MPAKNGAAHALLFCPVNPVTPVYATLAPCSLVYWREANAIIAFGVSWLVKCEAILKDE